MKTATLKDLVKLGAGDVGRALQEAGKDDPNVKAAAPSLGGAVAEMASGELERAMDTGIYEVLANVWAKYDKVRETAEKSRKKPDDLHNVKLFEHDFTHTMYPTVTFYVADQPVSELKLTLEIAARFKSVDVGIRNAAIESIASGKGSVLLRLKYDKVKLKELPSQEIDLPGSWKLKEPLAVG